MNVGWTNQRPGTAPKTLAAAVLALGAASGIVLALALERLGTPAMAAASLGLVVSLAILVGWSNTSSP